MESDRGNTTVTAGRSVGLHRIRFTFPICIVLALAASVPIVAGAAVDARRTGVGQMCGGIAGFNAPKGGDGFLVGPGGTAVHRSQSEMIESITSAGAVRRGPSTATSEAGEIFDMSTPNGPMEIRVMSGRAGGGAYQGRRTVVTRPGTKEYVNPNGSRIEGAVPKSERKAIGHTHGQTP
jgi:hypothetical protein